MDKSDQDATEFLVKVLKQLDTELKIPYTNHMDKRKSLSYHHILLDNLNNEWLGLIEADGYSIVKELFYSTIIPRRKCVFCGYE